MMNGWSRAARLSEKNIEELQLVDPLYQKFGQDSVTPTTFG